MNVNRYQFDSIVTKTKKQIIPIRRSYEDDFFYELSLIECRMHKFHKNYSINGRQAKEIIQIVLLDINAAIIGDSWDSSNFEEDCYSICVNEIEKLFFPDKNPDLMKQLKSGFKMDEHYFELARKVLVRIHESIEQWTTDFGSNGYFNFIAEFMDREIVDNGIYLVSKDYLNE